MEYYFEWDANKAKKNLVKHKISFDRASTIFRDPNALSIYDAEHSIEEDRWVTMGSDNSGILLIVCHTFTQNDNEEISIRIISSRKANKTESKQYMEI